MFEIEEVLNKVGMDSVEMLTPRTKSGYVHIKGITLLQADDDYAVRPISVDMRNSTFDFKVSNKKIKSRLRGSGFVIHFYNEDGKEWDQIFQFHKGNTFVARTDLRNDLSVDDLSF